MRILVVGAGATGGYFGGRLAQAGRDVTFLVRPSRAESLARDGLRIESPHGNAKIHPQFLTAADIASPYDVVLLTVKGYALERALEDIAPAVGPETTIFPLLNGMRHLDFLRARFGDGPAIGGVCIVSTHLEDDGRIVQLAELQELVYGEIGGGSSPRIAALDRALQGAGFAARLSEHIVREMWEKWVMLAALGGITCSMRGTVGDVEAAGGEAFARAFLRECASVAGAAGHEMTEEYLNRFDAMLTARGSGLTSSMYRDLQRGSAVEADDILGELLERARAAKLETPLLAAAYLNLRVYERRRVASPA